LAALPSVHEECRTLTNDEDNIIFLWTMLVDNYYQESDESQEAKKSRMNYL
jgi:hypothetical protein